MWSFGAAISGEAWVTFNPKELEASGSDVDVDKGKLF